MPVTDGLGGGAAWREVEDGELKVMAAHKARVMRVRPFSPTLPDCPD